MHWAVTGRIVGYSVIFWSFMGGVAVGEVRLPRLFASHMVIQRDKPVPVWGWAGPGENVTVALAGQKVSAVAAMDGKWRVVLAPVKAGGPFQVVVQGNNRIVLDDVWAGEVWICGGQSNMEMPVGNGYRPDVYPGIRDFQKELATADQPQVRLFLVDHKKSQVRCEDVDGPGWQVCTPSSAARFSAVGYLFARYIHTHLRVPVGMVEVAKSSTTAEAWTGPDELLRSVGYDMVSGRYVDGARRIVLKEPGQLFQGMIAPLAPFAMRGVIFYQGENNARDPAGYRKLFPALIRSWRGIWEQGDFPFLYVQLAGFGGKPGQAGENGGWMALREAQTEVLKLPGTGMAVAIDIGARQIHPPDKQDVALRLGLLARALVYGEKIECHGPEFRGMEISGGKVYLRFDHVDGGLVVGRHPAGDAAAGGLRVRGFAVAGADGIYHWADARVEGDGVALHCPEVPQPVSVRYAWSGNPECDLYNKAGLPAPPFRTDRD